MPNDTTLTLEVGSVIKVANEKNSIVEVHEVHDWGISGCELEGPKGARRCRMRRSIDWARIERVVE